MTWNDLWSRRFSGAVLALLLLGADARGACAQGGPDRPLTAADVTRLMPLLKVNISDLQALHASASTMAQIIEETDDALTKRTLEPLPWLKAHGQEVIVPPAARYDVSCSKAASRFHSFPMAVFTLVSAAKGPASRSASVPPPSPALTAARSFYKSLGFPSSHILTTYGSDEWTYVQKDGAENEVFAVNIYTVNEKLAGCESMPPGPMVARALHLAEAAASPPEPALVRALSAAGMSKDDYDDAVSALTAARRLAGGDSSVVEGMESLLPLMSGAELARTRAAIAVTKANLAVYRAHAAALEPLLASYVRLMESGK